MLQNFKYFCEPCQAVCTQLLPSKMTSYQAVPCLAVNLYAELVTKQFMDLLRDPHAQPQDAGAAQL